MKTEEELLRFLAGLDGKWGSSRKKRKFVEAAGFGDVFPRGWKVLLGLRRKEGVPSLYYRRYIRFKLVLDRLQLDNQLPLTLMPLLLAREDMPDLNHPVFKATITMSQDNVDGTQVYTYVYVRVTEKVWRINIHEPIIWAVAEFYNNLRISSIPSSSGVTQVDPEIRIDVFEAERPGCTFQVQQRIGTYFFKGILYGFVGFACGLVGQGIANAIMTVKRGKSNYRVGYEVKGCILHC